MASGKKETDPETLARYCDQFKCGAQKYYDAGPTRNDMWFFELYHHLSDCADALRAHIKGASE
jgi:hypothetical protein